MSQHVNAGIIGCGNISEAYLDAAKTFPGLNITCCADLNRTAAETTAEEHGIQAVTIDELLTDPDIAIVINLTTPQAHAAVNMQALQAGKHVYCEKPYAVTREDGADVLAFAAEHGLLTGCAPDTFLGGGLQTCRKLIDDGEIGKPIAGTAFLCSHGPEGWHPNPGFYYLKGGGPLFDMGPYYLTALVHLLGPIKRVAAICGKGFEERTATSEVANGQILPVEVNTHAAGTLEFHSGTLLTIVMSFDVWQHSSHPIEIHGTNGSLRVPDPNCFDGPVSLFQPGMDEWKTMPMTHGYTGNMRSIGVADLAYAILGGRPNRCGGEMAYHVLDVMHAFDESSESGNHVEIQSGCTQPAALPIGLPQGQLDH